MTAVEWLVDKILVENEVYTNSESDCIDNPRIEYINAYKSHVDLSQYVQQAKKREKEETENKAIHFAEWLTGKHTLTLMSLYEQFEETEYKHQSNKESL